MITFQIKRPDEAIRQALVDRINSLAKPKGSLGRLESLALQIGMIQQTLHPVLSHPINVILRPTTASPTKVSVSRPRK